MQEEIVLKASAYAPGHITGFFKIYRDGSTGAGVNIEKGAITTVSAKKGRGRISIFINGKRSFAPTSRNVLGKYLKYLKEPYSITIKHRVEMPIGYGLGMSGAGALSLSLALNKALNLKLPKQDCVNIAKNAEIEEGSGLGDVIAEQFYGLMIGKRPYPSTHVEIIPIRERYAVLAFFAPIVTKKIIRSKKWKKKINSAGGKCMKELDKRKTLGNFTKLCNYFSFETGLAQKKLRKIIEEMPFASMAMLGQTLFIITNNPARAKKMLLKYTKRVAVSKIAQKGAFAN